MKVKLRGVRKIPIKGDYIKLDGLLKYSSVASTGGEAKYLIKAGEVFVCGVPCFERGRKLKPGDVVKCGSEVVIVDKTDVSG